MSPAFSVPVRGAKGGPRPGPCRDGPFMDGKYLRGRENTGKESMGKGGPPVMAAAMADPVTRRGERTGKTGAVPAHDG